jgi:hypothetical protein
MTGDPADFFVRATIAAGRLCFSRAAYWVSLAGIAAAGLWLILAR